MLPKASGLLRQSRHVQQNLSKTERYQIKNYVETENLLLDCKADGSAYFDCFSKVSYHTGGKHSKQGCSLSKELPKIFRSGAQINSVD